MGKMGKYCKAYPITRFREYKGWMEKTENVRREKKIVDGKEVESDRQLTEKDHLYLQENFVVTDDIFIDEHIIFDEVTPEWIGFCKDTLKFEVPVYEPVMKKEGEETGKTAS
jgi:hypothetical protein